MKASVVFTAVVSQDEETGLFSAYCAELPEAMSQGETEHEAVELLADLLPYVLHDRRDEGLDKMEKVGYSAKKSITTSKMMYVSAE